MKSRGTFASSSRVNPDRKVDKEGTMLNKLFGGKREEVTFPLILLNFLATISLFMK